MDKIILILVIMLSSCAHPDPWTKRDTALQLIATATIIGDAITTERIQDVPNVYEAGPIAKEFLGPQPSTKDTIIYFSCAIVFSWLAARLLPAKWRPYWQGWEIAAHSYAIKNNCDNGLC